MTPVNKLPLHWDSFDAYLFDIDGTLLQCEDATHYYGFCHALRRASGRELTLEGVVAHGNTDAGILRDALTQAGIPESEWRLKLPAICEWVGEFVTARGPDLCPTVLPYVGCILQHLKSKGALLGVATGNLQVIGRLKLERAGLADFFSFGAYSDGCESRSEVFRKGRDMVAALHGQGSSICVLGDTPADVKAARANGMPVIAVATGIFSIDELLSEAPDLCVRSFEELLSEG